MIALRALDNLELFDLKEDPDAWENLVHKEIERGSSDRAASEVIESMYWDEDRGRAFQRFFESIEFACIQQILRVFGVSHGDAICEVGAGSGYLVWALSRVGFRQLSLLEPNPHFITGTGYLSSRTDSSNIIIHNDIRGWNASPSTYRVLITRNCVHHFKNISLVAATIRQKLRPGALWFMFREWYADSPQELYTLLQTHPYCQRYAVYEYPFPASHYMEATAIAGFQPMAVVPARYANDCMGAYIKDLGSENIRRFTRFIDTLLRHGPSLTLLAYHGELVANRYFAGRFRYFSRPQVMVFRRSELT